MFGKHTTMTADIVQWPAKFTKNEQDLILDCCKFSWLAYSDPTTVAKLWTAKQDGTLVVDPAKPAASDALMRATEMPQFVTCPSCDAQCYIIRYQGAGLDKPMLVVAIRGTTSIMDWLCDASVNQVQFRDATDRPVAGTEVHAGFYRQFIGLLSLCDSQIKAHLKAGGQLMCTGHSLAAGVSTIAAVNYGNTYPEQVWNASFGSPRVGNAAFAATYKKCVKLQARVKHARDPVPAAVPPIDYSHVGPETHLGEADPYGEIPVLLDAGDHSIARYAQAIQNPSTVKTAVPSASTTGSWLLRAMSAFRCI